MVTEVVFIYLSGGLVLEESDDGDLVVCDELLDGFGVGQVKSWRSGLLLQPGHDGVGGTASAVLNRLAVAEELQGGVATDLQIKLRQFSSLVCHRVKNADLWTSRVSV